MATVHYTRMGLDGVMSFLSDRNHTVQWYKTILTLTNARCDLTNRGPSSLHASRRHLRSKTRAQPAGGSMRGSGPATEFVGLRVCVVEVRVHSVCVGSFLIPGLPPPSSLQRGCP